MADYKSGGPADAQRFRMCDLYITLSRKSLNNQANILKIYPVTASRSYQSLCQVNNPAFLDDYPLDTERDLVYTCLKSR